jgi:hypothetical protein
VACRLDLDFPLSEVLNSCVQVMHVAEPSAAYRKVSYVVGADLWDARSDSASPRMRSAPFISRGKAGTG